MFLTSLPGVNIMTVTVEWGECRACLQLSAFFCPFMHQQLWGFRQAAERHEKASTKLFVFVRVGRAGKRNLLNIKSHSIAIIANNLYNRACPNMGIKKFNWPNPTLLLYLSSNIKHRSFSKMSSMSNKAIHKLHF